jgi:PAS domain S-box-containing protein
MDAAEWHAAIVAAALDCIITIDAEGCILEFNPAAERVFGYRFAEVIGREMAGLIVPPRYRERHREGLARYLATGETHVLGRRIELAGLRADGTEFPLELTITRLGTEGAAVFTAFIRDITDRAQAEAALRASEASYRAIFDSSNDAVFIHDVETGAILDVNRKACDQLGYSAEEFRQLGVAALIVEGSESTPEAALARMHAAANGEPQLFEWLNRSRSGQLIWNEVNLQRAKIDGVDRLIATTRDITERKREEEKLRERADSVVRFQTILMDLTKSDLSDLDAALHGVTENDARTLDVERVSVWFFNEQKTEIVCRDLYEMTPARHSSGARLEAANFPNYFAALATQRTIAAGDAANHSATSEFRDNYLKPLGIVSMLDVPIWRHGRMIGVICHEHIGEVRSWGTEELDFAASIADFVALALEASERRQAEEALRVSEARFRTIFERSPDALAFFDTETGTFADCNEAALRLLRCTKGHLVGKQAWELAPPIQPDGRSSKDVALEIIQVVARNGSARFEWQHGRGDGTNFPAEISVTVVEFAERPMWVAVIRDVTARKEAEAEVARVHASLEQRVKERTAELGRANEILRAQHVEVERANRAKSEFLSRMSHELRTPMNSILGFGQVLARKVTASDQEKYVRHILNAGRHLLELINEVLDISRIEADQLRLSSEPVALAGVIQESINLVQHLAAEHEIETGTSPAAADIFVMADRQRLTQVLVNLLSNGVKYNRRGGRVTVTGATAGDRAQIAVTDTGRGIPVELLDRLFNPFDRLGAEDSEIEGTGLGLALSKRLVEHMGGTVRVSSEVNVGTEFVIELPLAKNPQEGLRTRQAGGADSTTALADGPRYTALYIEDNAANLSLVETILAEVPSMRLVAETRGEAGIARALELRPDLIFLDMHLPDVPGDQVLRRLKSDPRTQPIPIIVVSADATASHIKAVLADGARHYLTKPLDVDRFLSVVSATLQTRDS